MANGPVSTFIEHHYRHFNAAALMDAAKGYVTHLDEGGKMMITLAGAMSTAELGLSLAEMIRQDKAPMEYTTLIFHFEDNSTLVYNTGKIAVRMYKLMEKNCNKEKDKDLDTFGVVFTTPSIIFYLARAN